MQLIFNAHNCCITFHVQRFCESLTVLVCYFPARLAATGLMLGPFNHYWYSMLDRVLPSVTVLTVGKKILADQTVAAPCFAITFFMGKTRHEWLRALSMLNFLLINLYLAFIVSSKCDGVFIF